MSELDTTPTRRDFVMARLAAARNCAMAIVEGIDEITSLMVGAEDDLDDRIEALAEALDAAGSCARALEAAERVLPEIDPEQPEPWDTDDGGEASA